MGIYNEYELTDKIATSGQPGPGDFADIAARGYRTVINLAMPDHEKSIGNEGELVAEQGMTYIHIPVPFNAPNEDLYDKFSACMDALSEEAVWVHCIVNARVSAFLYRYLQTHRGASVEAATSPVLRAWRPEMDSVWLEFIQRDQKHK